MSKLQPETNVPAHRDNDWLADLLADLWYRHFPDVLQPNDVRIKFGQAAATRLGSIKWGRKAINHPDGTTQRRSIITITSHFRDPSVPETVVRGVIAHELVHYAHGFSSPNPKLHRHPHHGGIVERELRRRGLGSTLESEQDWLKDIWPSFLKRHHQPKRRHRYHFLKSKQFLISG
ncbi:hypothetical protein HY524_00910 [Candidatus Berkelbacteria bacterium]|nr:hypothetical protein [Candidatus Berkelbacteria bacterium]